MGIPIFLIDPHDVVVYSRRDVNFIKEPASTGVKKMLEMLNQMK
jgi:hypothetical protein